MLKVIKGYIEGIETRVLVTKEFIEFVKNTLVTFDTVPSTICYQGVVIHTSELQAKVPSLFEDNHGQFK